MAAQPPRATNLYIVIWTSGPKPPSDLKVNTGGTGLPKWTWCLVPSGPASLYSMGGAGFAERPPPTFVLGEDPIVFEQPGHLDFELRYPAVLLTRRLHSFGFECSAQPPTRRVRRSDLRRSVRAWYLHLYEAPKAARTVGPRPREPLALWSSLRCA